jgi:hypothetical protein
MTNDTKYNAYSLAEELHKIDAVTEVRASTRKITVAFGYHDFTTHDDLPTDAIEAMMDVFEDTPFQFEYSDGSPLEGMEEHTSYGNRNHDRITDPTYVGEFQASYVNTT